MHYGALHNSSDPIWRTLNPATLQSGKASL
ncbi:protein of unknown function [Azospirillum baldaniorum]|uniref:Uncharacterized protein n=1 Tax=Azospirillum baldaniorum TaxID=1064539 RepID=A0A9P1JQZ3_9PROT|nr:protein of unknown function [Azospirillum baldaniorum]